MIASHSFTRRVATPNEEMQEAINETIASRKIFYRLGESEVFDYANKNTVINGKHLVDVIPLMVLPDQGFVQVGYEQLDKEIQYELFEGPHYKISCKKAMRDMIDNGSIVMVYSDTYKLPTCLPYIIQGTTRSARIFVNVSDFLQMDQYGKYQIIQSRNFNALMAVLFAAAVALSFVWSNTQIPADLCDGLVLTYASMFERCINSIVHMDPITREKVRYLASEFELIQMYGTEDGQAMFIRRYRDKFFPKLTKMITETIDAQFQLDCFDKLSFFVEELKRNYPSMRGLSDYQIYDKWIRIFGSSTALSIDYPGYHIYTICMVLFESPLISRMALEPVMEKNKGTEMYRRMQTVINGN